MKSTEPTKKARSTSTGRTESNNFNLYRVYETDTLDTDEDVVLRFYANSKAVKKEPYLLPQRSKSGYIKRV